MKQQTFVATATVIVVAIISLLTSVILKHNLREW